MIWKIFYNVVVVPIMWSGFGIYTLFNSKAKRARLGRKGLLQRLKNEISKLEDNHKRIWFHSSSMGEFEQAKPIIAELKNRYPDIQIVVSFFSPSGYEHSLSYKLANVITYIPFDSFSNAREFVQIVSPDAAVLMRYDIWPNHLWELKSRNTPILIANATLRKKISHVVPVIKHFISSLYNEIDYISVVSEKDKNNFDALGLKHPRIEIIGDTRYDQVMQRSIESKMRQLIDSKIYFNKKVLVVGSSWMEDEERLLPAMVKLFSEFSQLLVILVPHEPTEDNLDLIEKELNGIASSIRFSYLHQYSDEKVILVDSVGILMGLYQYAQVAYVGGGFGSGVHNILEPAVYGIPVIFGPKFYNSQEAITLVNECVALVGKNEEELYKHLKELLSNDIKRNQMGEKAYSLVRKNIGATERFIEILKEVL